jgi:hypothetical protein
MNTIQPINGPPLSCELEEELLVATDSDFNLAQQVSGWNLELKEGVYIDGEYSYYSIIMEVSVMEISVRGISDRIINKKVWIRSTVKMYPGGHWEPDDYDEVLVDGDEVLVDGDEVFLSLSDAVKQSKLDGYERELMEMDNFCPICDGSGLKDHFAEIPCPSCGGKGYRLFIKPKNKENKENK